MAVQLSRVRVFIPESVNKGRDDTEKIKVYLRTIDVYTKQTHIRKFIGKTGQELMASMTDDKGSKEMREFLDKHVVKFENLEYVPEPDDPTLTEEQRKPRTATIEDVWNAGEFQLCIEIFTNILHASQLSKEETKNSESQSGSAPTLQAQVH